MIPRIIHYCWFGKNELPDITKKCIESWKKHCPDYEIIEWNEDNFNVSSIKYTAQAYAEQKYAFVADYARFKILYEYGGIYLDTDVEIVKSIDNLLNHIVFLGREEKDRVNPGLIIGAEKNNDFIAEMIELYQNLRFRKENEKLKTIVDHTSDMLLLKGWVPDNKIQEIERICIYPVECFCPKSYNTGVVKISEKTYSIHHFDSSWFTNKEKNRLRLQQIFNKFLGIKLGSKILGSIYYYKENGFVKTIKRIKVKFSKY